MFFGPYPENNPPFLSLSLFQPGSIPTPLSSKPANAAAPGRTNLHIPNGSTGPPPRKQMKVLRPDTEEASEDASSEETTAPTPPPPPPTKTTTTTSTTAPVTAPNKATALVKLSNGKVVRVAMDFLRQQGVVTSSTSSAAAAPARNGVAVTTTTAAAASPAGAQQRTGLKVSNEQS